jgi:hypothetical protein
MVLFRILLVFDLLGLLALLYFFADGMRYPSSGGDYFGVWLPLLAVPTGVMALAWVLKGKGHTTPANVLLGILAAPGVLYLLFIAMFIVLQPDMR